MVSAWSPTSRCSRWRGTSSTPSRSLLAAAISDLEPGDDQLPLLVRPLQVGCGLRDHRTTSAASWRGTPWRRWGRTRRRGAARRAPTGASPRRLAPRPSGFSATPPSHGAPPRPASSAPPGCARGSWTMAFDAPWPPTPFTTCCRASTRHAKRLSGGEHRRGRRGGGPQTAGSPLKPTSELARARPAGGFEIQEAPELERRGSVTTCSRWRTLGVDGRRRAPASRRARPTRASPPGRPLLSPTQPRRDHVTRPDQAVLQPLLCRSARPLDVLGHVRRHAASGSSPHAPARTAYGAQSEPLGFAPQLACVSQRGGGLLSTILSLSIKILKNQ